MILIRIALIIFVFSFPAGATENTFPAGLPMMPATKVNLILSEDESTTIEYPSRPCVYNNIVNLIPGETVLVDAEINGNKLINLKHVKKAEHLDHTIEWEFSQNRDGKSPFMLLKIKNPFNKGLIYEEEVTYLGKGSTTTSWRVVAPPNKVSFETWPGPLTQIQLKNFRLDIPAE